MKNITFNVGRPYNSKDDSVKLTLEFKAEFETETEALKFQQSLNALVLGYLADQSVV